MTDWFWEQPIEELKENVISSSHYQRVWLCLLQSCTNVFYLFLRHFPCPQVGVLRSWWQMYLAVAVIRIFSRLTTSIKMRPSHHLPPASCLLPPSSHMLIAITSCLTVDCSNCFTRVKHNIDLNARNIFLMYYNVSLFFDDKIIYFLSGLFILNHL